MTKPDTTKNHFEVGDEVQSFRRGFNGQRVTRLTIVKVMPRSVWTDDGRRWATSEWVSDSWSVVGKLYRTAGATDEIIKLASVTL